MKYTIELKLSSHSWRDPTGVRRSHTWPTVRSPKSNLLTDPFLNVCLNRFKHKKIRRPFDETASVGRPFDDGSEESETRHSQTYLFQ